MEASDGEVSSPMANMRAQVIDRRNGGVDLLNCLAVENEINKNGQWCTTGW